MTDAPASRQLSAAAGNILASEHRLKAAGGYSALSAFALANSMLWNSVHPFLLPILVFALVADADGPNTWIGIITFIGLVVAMIIQPIAGALSDAAKSRWGPSPAVHCRRNCWHDSARRRHESSQQPGDATRRLRDPPDGIQLRAGSLPRADTGPGAGKPARVGGRVSKPSPKSLEY